MAARWARRQAITGVSAALGHSGVIGPSACQSRGGIARDGAKEPPAQVHSECRKRRATCEQGFWTPPPALVGT